MLLTFLARPVPIILGIRPKFWVGSPTTTRKCRDETEIETEIYFEIETEIEIYFETFLARPV